MMMSIWLEGRTNLQGSVGYRHRVAFNMFHHLRNANFQRLYWTRYLQLLGTGMLQFHLQSDFYVFTPAKSKYADSAGAVEKIHPMMFSDSKFPTERAHINGIWTVL